MVAAIDFNCILVSLYVHFGVKENAYQVKDRVHEDEHMSMMKLSSQR